MLREKLQLNHNAIDSVVVGEGLNGTKLCLF